jgi:hypothetical protein
MAIKGKSKPKARRGVTAGPRPVYAPVKRPLLQRRSFQLGVFAAIAVVSLAAIAYGIARVRAEQRAEELDRRQRAAATRYSTPVEAALVPVGQAAPPSGFDLQTGLQQDIDAFAAGELSPTEATRAGAGYADAADEAADALAEIDVTSIAGGKGFDGGFVRDFFNANAKMESGLRMHAEAARLLREAASAEGRLRARLLERATAVREVGTTAFANGYRDYVNLRAEAGIFQTQFPFQPGGGRD